MKVLQILPELNVGGVETGTVDFSKYLVAQGHKSFVVSYGGALVDALEATGGVHFTFPVHKKSLFKMIKMVKVVRAIILKHNIDIVHARSRVPAWIAFFACRKTKASFITTCHGYYKSYFFSQVMGWAKIVIVPSKIIGRHMIEDFKVRAGYIRCIPRSVDLEKFKHIKEKSIHDSGVTITIVGRITPLKGHRYFLQAMGKVVRANPYAKIWIVGDAPSNKEAYLRELKALVKRCGLSNNVEFLGNRKDVPDILEKTDVLVMSSVVPESFGRVILEAQAASVPVVATKVGGVVDIIDDEKTGLLVEAKDIDAMARAVLRLLNDKSFGQRLTVEAKKKIKNQFLLKHMAASTIEVYEELLAHQNILVIKLSALGDVVLITAALRAIRKKFREAKIHVLIGKPFRKVLQNCPYVDGLIFIDRKEKDKGPLGLFKFGCKLHKHRFDKIIDFQNNKLSHLLAWFCFPKESYGYNNRKWGGLLTNSIADVKRDLPPVEHQFEILKLLDIAPTDQHLQLWPSPKEKNSVKALLEEEWLGNAKRIVGMNMAASQQWPSKNWSLDNYVKLCDMLSLQNIRVVITGMEKDRAAAAELCARCKSKPANLAGKTDVMQLAALIGRCQVYVTPDSAPLHIAAAMGVPIVAFFGPTTSKRHVPPTKKLIVFEKMLPCAPCYSGRCLIGTHDCMEQIEPTQVFDAICSLLGGAK
ncbi:lipopolysaccharide heptosyltransferase II [Candidatus Omnitrophota bacterium]